MFVKVWSGIFLIMISIWCINLLGAILNGNIELGAYIMQHKVIFGLILAYFVGRKAFAK